MKESKVKKVGGVKTYACGTDVNKDMDVKTSGVKTRGNGAATKGTMARGPMA
mgnify:CR=1 FL=1